MVRWLCNAAVRDGQISEELRSRLSIESISEAMRTGRLCWFGRVERKDKNEWVKLVKHLEVEGGVPVSGARKTWDEALRRSILT